MGTHGREPEFERWVGDSGLLVVHFPPIPPHYYNIRPVLVWLLLEWIGGGSGWTVRELTMPKMLAFHQCIILGYCWALLIFDSGTFFFFSARGVFPHRLLLF